MTVFWESNIIASIIINNIQFLNEVTLDEIIETYVDSDKCVEEAPDINHPYGSVIVYIEDIKLIIDNITLNWTKEVNPYYKAEIEG